MDLVINFIFLIIFGLVGFATNKVFGLNPYKLFSDISAILLILVMMLFAFPVIINPDNSLTVIENLSKFLVDVLPGAIIGDLAGSFVAAVTGEKV